MSQHKGINPAGQSRSLRSIAEAQNSPALFTLGEGVSEDAQDQPVARDPAEAARPTMAANRGLFPTDPRPFANLKG